MSSLLKGIAAVVFDVDDTLVFTAQNGYHKCVRVAQKLQLDPPSLEQFAAVYGRISFIECIAQWHPSLNDYDQYQTLYERLQTEFPDKPCGHATTVIEMCKRHRLRVGILTNGPYKKTIRKLHAANIDLQVLDGLWHADNLPCLKPDARSIIPMLTMWKIPSQCVLYIGDALTDWKVAQTTGMRFALVLTGLSSKTYSNEYLPLSGAWILETIDDLLLEEYE